MVVDVRGKCTPGAVLYDYVVLLIIDNVAVIEAGDVGVLQKFEVIYFSYDLLEGSGGILIELLDGYLLTLWGGDLPDCSKRSLA